MKLTEFTEILINVTKDIQDFVHNPMMSKFCRPKDICEANEFLRNHIYKKYYLTGLIDVVPEFEIIWEDHIGGMRLNLKDVNLQKEF